MSAPQADGGRLWWRARRGLLELDWLLQTFLKRHAGSLSAEWQPLFETLLDYPDPLLLDVLLLRQPAPQPELMPLVAAIREAAQIASPPG